MSAITAAGSLAQPMAVRPTAMEILGLSSWLESSTLVAMVAKGGRAAASFIDAIRLSEKVK